MFPPVHGELLKTRVACCSEIFLAEVAEIGADSLRDIGAIVDDKAHVGACRNRAKRLGYAQNFFRRRLFCPQLYQVRAALTELLGHLFRRAPAQIRGIDEGIEPAMR